MKGFSETRGQASKIEFDHNTRQFVSIPIAHEFTANHAPHIVVQKLGELRLYRQRKNIKQQTKKVLSAISPQARDDVGMTEVFASSR